MRRPVTWTAAALLAVAIPLLASACSDPGAAGAGAAPSPSGASSAAASGMAASTATARATAAERTSDDEVKPLYPIDKTPPDPLAERFCQAVHDTEAARRGECCGVTGERGRFTSECARTVSVALRSGAISVDAAAVDACSAAVAKDLAGCGWVGAVAPELPAACEGLLTGTLAASAVCRSTLECGDGLVCQGLTATRTGKCAPPKPAGLACGGSTDTLAALTRQKVDRTRPECAGYCARVACKDAVAVGGACKLDDECGAGHRCSKGACTADPLPAAGAACEAGRCATGARCVKDRCAAPKGEGEACESDVECRGACDRAAGSTAGACGKRCIAATIPTKSAFSIKSTPAR